MQPSHWPAWAASRPPWRRAPIHMLEEVVVTARKVTEPYWTVPLTIDVLDRDRLITASVADLAALARMAPGLYFESLWGGTGSAPVLRGQSQPNAAGDNVGVFVGGVYQAERTAIDVAPLDVERIEVVHGPQSTLFGHSTFTGAIHYVPRSATREFTSGIELGAGSDDYWAASGFLSGPLPGAALLGRVAAGSRNASGTWTNSADGNSLGDYSRNALAASVVTASTGPWKGELAGRWSRTESAHPAQTSIDGTSFNCGAIEQASNYWSYFCGSAAGFELRSELSAGLPDSTNEVTQVSLSTCLVRRGHDVRERHELLQGHQRYLSRLRFDERRRDVRCVHAYPSHAPRRSVRLCPPVARLVQANSVSRQTPETEEWSQELRLHGAAGDRLDWLVGVTGFLTRRVQLRRSFGFERGDLAAERGVDGPAATDAAAGRAGRARKSRARRRSEPRAGAAVEDGSRSPHAGRVRRPVLSADRSRRVASGTAHDVGAAGARQYRRQFRAEFRHHGTSTGFHRHDTALQHRFHSGCQLALVRFRRKRLALGRHQRDSRTVAAGADVRPGVQLDL